MKKLVIAVIVLIAGVSLSLFLASGKAKPQPKAVSTPPAPLVDVLHSAAKKIRLRVKTQGTVQPRREIDIVSQVAGIIEQSDQRFASGAFFTKGSTLLKIEDADYRFALIRTEARIAEAEQLLATERARAAQANKEWRDLGQKDANALFLRKPQLASAKAQFLAAKADRSEAELNLRRTEIKAPFNSRIRNKYVDEGQYVTPGTPIAKLYSTDSVEVRIPLTDKQLALIDMPGAQTKREQAPKALLSAYYAGKKHQWQGRLVRTEASIDINSRVVYAIIEVEKPFQNTTPDNSRQSTLAIGMFVEAEIEGLWLDNVIELPRLALQVDQKILILDDNNRLKFRAVKILQSNSQSVLLDGANFQAGERIVISNLPMAVEGMLVSPQLLAPQQTAPTEGSLSTENTLGKNTLSSTP